jgi:hypothetical protein
MESDSKHPEHAATISRPASSAIVKFLAPILSQVKSENERTLLGSGQQLKGRSTSSSPKWGLIALIDFSMKGSLSDIVQPGKKAYFIV